MSKPDTNQASEDELGEILEGLVYDTPNSYGYPPDFDPDFAKAKQAIQALIRTEKLKLLAEAKVLIKAGGYEASYEISMIEKLERIESNE